MSTTWQRGGRGASGAFHRSGGCCSMHCDSSTHQASRLLSQHVTPVPPARHRSAAPICRQQEPPWCTTSRGCSAHCGMRFKSSAASPAGFWLSTAITQHPPAAACVSGRPPPAPRAAGSAPPSAALPSLAACQAAAHAAGSKTAVWTAAAATALRDRVGRGGQRGRGR